MLKEAPSATAPHKDDAAAEQDDVHFDLPKVGQRRGRPIANVFQRAGTPRGDPYLEARRAVYLYRLDRWHRKYPSRIKWVRLQHEDDPNWKLYQAAELAMAVMGRKTPEKLDDKPWHRHDKCTFDQEAKVFIYWLRNEFENCWQGIRGPKPDFLKTYKCAVSLAVARYVVCKIGGRHYNHPPTPREIAQVWFVLFGEHEPHDSIKNRLPVVARLCRQFAKDRNPLLRKQAEYFRMAGDCILRKLTPKKPKRSRRAPG